MVETKIEDAENSFVGIAKTSVKLIKNSKGINWEIKVVSGEQHLLEGLMEEAIKCHNKILERIPREQR